jgi:hypothetical protein
MRAGGAPSAPSAGTVRIASSEVKTASPVAVASARVSPSMPAITAARSLVGETSTFADFAKDTRPRL